ncbi:MAG: cobalamin biosynthesis protein, partial [Alphaproteobacteria bacterium]|nr:cobalamin biosynthesis protein [Alphaproteobacteria bacterium]
MNDQKPIALVALTQRGAETALRARTLLPQAVIYGKADRVTGADQSFDDTLACLRDLYAQGWTIIGLCAAGIVIRALASLAGDKWQDAPILSVSEDGAMVVPLLGGHRGANSLATVLAEGLGGTAAITTAGDRTLGFALDDLPDGWILKTPNAVKSVTAQLLAGQAVTLRQECGDPAWPPKEAFQSVGPGETPQVLITDRLVDPTEGQVVLIPPSLAIGIGCERHAPAEGLVDFVQSVLAETGIDPSAIAAIGTVDLKGDESALKAISAALDRPLRLFTPAELEALTPHLPNPSDIVFQEIGCHGVAEASALALAGRTARFVSEKRRSGPYTCAIARAQESSVDISAGRSPGRLFVVGIGPGDAAYRTGAAARAILASDAVVGYQLYLDLAADLIGDRPIYDS